MAHTHDDVLIEVQTAMSDSIPPVHDVSQVYSDSDTQWWVTDAEHNTFAYAWYDTENVLHTEPYHP